jgi:hypothetical protein
MVPKSRLFKIGFEKSFEKSFEKLVTQKKLLPPAEISKIATRSFS